MGTHVFFNDLLSKLKISIRDFELKIDDPVPRIEKTILLILKYMSKIKEYVLRNGFKNDDEEIFFFKVCKPQIVSKLIYYNTIYKIEIEKPFGGKLAIEDYLRKELIELKRFYDMNIEFYKYYRTNSSYLDHKYFVRKNYDIKLSLDTAYLDADHRFSTSHDYKVAKIIANDMIQKYIEERLYNISVKWKTASQPNLNWTDSKTALVELIYALHYQGVFDNGNRDIRIIAQYFETVFNVDLGDFYHTFIELKSRKINRTKFLDSLKEGLLKKMDDQNGE